jgi:hypothetical protein
MHSGFHETITSVTVGYLHTLPTNITHVLSDTTGLCQGHLRERDHLAETHVYKGGGYQDGSSGSGMWGEWNGSIWLRTETGGEHM